MAQTLDHDEAALAGRRMAERMAGASAWLTEWGFMAPAIVAARTERGDGDAATDTELDTEEVLGIVDGRYRRPDMEVRIINAHRVHASRQSLLDSGAFTVKQLAEALDRPVNTVRKVLQRASKRGALFTVTVGGETHIPSVLLDEALDVRSEWQPVISVLQEAGLSSWVIWGWIAEPNAGLSGEIAAEVITSNPERVCAAARRRLIQAFE